MDDMERAQYLDAAVNGIRREDNPTRAREILRILFRQGCNPNSSLSWKKEQRTYYPWLKLITEHGFQPDSSAAWAGVEVFLEFGAYHPEWTRSSTDFGEIYVVTISISGGDLQFIGVNSRIDEKDKLSRPLPPFLRKLGGRAYLQDIVKFAKPENANAILQLLNKPAYSAV